MQTRSAAFRRRRTWHISYELVLFDLDGTLTDSGLGIMNSVQYALKKIGRGVENLEELKCFVGPPLAQQFAKFCGFSDEKGIRW